MQAKKEEREANRKFATEHTGIVNIPRENRGSRNNNGPGGCQKTRSAPKDPSAVQKSVGYQYNNRRNHSMGVSQLLTRRSIGRRNIQSSGEDKSASGTEPQLDENEVSSNSRREEEHHGIT